jgi:hypothetical protein
VRPRLIAKLVRHPDGCAEAVSLTEGIRAPNLFKDFWRWVPGKAAGGVAPLV